MIMNEVYACIATHAGTGDTAAVRENLLTPFNRLFEEVMSVLGFNLDYCHVSPRLAQTHIDSFLEVLGIREVYYEVAKSFTEYFDDRGIVDTKTVREILHGVARQNARELNLEAPIDNGTSLEFMCPLCWGWTIIDYNCLSSAMAAAGLRGGGFLCCLDCTFRTKRSGFRAATSRLAAREKKIEEVEK